MKALAAILLFILVVCNAMAQSEPASSLARLLAVEGKVEIASPTGPWTLGTTNSTLKVGERVRTGARSRATVQLSDRSILRLSELTLLEIRPAQARGNAAFEMKNGASYFFNRERPGTVEFRTPLASGAIRGTEFHLLVAENGLTEVALVDGLVSLTNEFGGSDLTSGEKGTVEPGQAPRRTALLDVTSIIQWALYYPAVLSTKELPLSEQERTALAESIASYDAGDLLAADQSYPTGRIPSSEAEKLYRAATLLAVGQVDEATGLVRNISSPFSAALLQLIETVKGRPASRGESPASASEWMSESYALQASSKLPEALAAARKATDAAPSFGFASARVAELEFGFGRATAAQAALDKAIALSPRYAQAHALRGFAMAAGGQLAGAEDSFERAIALDPALANGWLGRGLVRIRTGREEEGRRDLQVAATLEPQRSLLRSYLGKAWSHTSDAALAEKELRLARKLDARDPTPWLYSAILAEQQNRVNDAVHDLERSQELNDNRSVFRSGMLLDSDRALRSANLARIYQDAGMSDWSLREASRSVSYDYANYSAHQFLANSYESLRDPRQSNLRYQAPAISEYFIANLLAPVGGTRLSSTVSQQEYTRLFDRNHAGVASSTEYFSNGDWVQQGVQYGRMGNTDWSLEAYYRTENGQRFNHDLERTEYTARIRQQLSPQDTVYAEVQRNETEGGDLFQHYSTNPADPNGRGPSAAFRYREVQEPNFFLGYHHEWSPGIHTLFFGGRFEDDLDYRDPNRGLMFFRQVNGQVTDVSVAPNAVGYDSDLEGYVAELQQIFKAGSHTLVMGGRFQYATVDTFNSVSNIGRINVALNNETHITRESAYIYDQWSPWRSLQLTAGLTYDHLRFPDNIDTSPITRTESARDQVSPKVCLLWQLREKTHVRAAYTRSLGGVFFDQSYRLEPTQVGGFNQAFRSIAPESSVGLVPGTRFETFGLGFDHEFPTRTYFNIDAELLRSDASRTLGVITNSSFIPVPDSPASARQRLDYEERSLTVSVNQLISQEWALGARYRLTDADLEGRFPGVNPAVANATGINQNEEATLHQLSLYAIYNLPCGFFAQAESVWTAQSNRGYSPSLEGDDFWQFNAYAGYRFWRRHAEARVGVLNITDQDYRLNPLTLHADLPRERTFYASFKFYF